MAGIASTMQDIRVAKLLGIPLGQVVRMVHHPVQDVIAVHFRDGTKRVITAQTVEEAKHVAWDSLTHCGESSWSL
jgi:hypothetical protein